MFERLFEEYRRILETSFREQESMYRRWLNGAPAQAEAAAPPRTAEAREMLGTFQERWAEALTEALEKHRSSLNEQYKSGIDAIESAFQTAEARTPEEYWRLTQEFWRKSIDAYKTTFEAQSKYLQNLAAMWLDLMTRPNG